MKSIKEGDGAFKNLFRKYRTEGKFGVFLAAIRRVFRVKSICVYYVYKVKLDKLAPKRPRFSEIKTTIYYGAVDEEIIDGLTAINNKRSTFQHRLDNGAVVVIGWWRGIPVGYLWGDASSIHLEERFGFEIPVSSDAVYYFDSYILPQYRGKTILSAMLTELALYSGMLPSRSYIVAIIDKSNLASISIHESLGFERKSLNFFLKLFGGNSGKWRAHLRLATYD